MEDAVTLNARHFIQMWQHLKRALEEFAQIMNNYPCSNKIEVNVYAARL